VRDGFISAVLAFGAVLVLAAAFRPPEPVQATPTPALGQVIVKCGIPDADCQKLAQAFAAQVQVENPGRRIVSITVGNYNSFEICFSEGGCEGQSSSGAVGPAPILETPGPEVETPGPAGGSTTSP